MAADVPARGRLRLVLSLLLLLLGVGGFVPGPLLWGVNHLAYAHPLIRILWPVAGLLLLWLPAGERIARGVTRVGARLLGARWIAMLALPLLGALLFWLARCANHFLGDGWFLGELITTGVPYHGYDFLAYHFHCKLFHALSFKTDTEAFHLIGTTSVWTGAVCLAVAGWGVRRITDHDPERVFLYALLVIAAPLQMFMGYVETYAQLYVGQLLFGILLILHYRKGWPLWALGGGFAVGLFFHLDALFLAPVLGAVVLVPPPTAPRRLAARVLAAGGPVLLGLGLAAAILLLGGYRERHFVFDFLHKERAPRLLVSLTGSHGLLSLRHWKDVLNLLLLLVPIPGALALAMTAGRTSERSGDQRLLRVLAFGCLWILLLMSVLHMKLGVFRDWDLLASQAVVFALGVFVAWPVRSGRRIDAVTAGRVVISASIIVLPWFWLNAGDERSLQRIRDVVSDQPRFVRAYVHEEIGKYYRKQNRMEDALAEYRICTEIFPSNGRLHSVRAAVEFNMGFYEESLATFHRAFEADSTHPLTLLMLARLHTMKGENEEAIAFSRRLAGKREEPPEAIGLHAELALDAGEYDEALVAYQRGRKRQPGNLDFTVGLGRVLFMQGDYEAAESAFRDALRQQPQSLAARMGLASSTWGLLRGQPDSWSDPATRRRLEEAVRLVEDLRSEGVDDDLLGRLETELRQALASSRNPEAESR